MRADRRLRLWLRSRWGRLQGRRTIHLLHIGKTGGTAIKTALRESLQGRGWRLELHGHGVRISDLPPTDQICFVLRDPLARFVSGFNSRKRKGYPAHHSEWNPAELAAFSRFDNANALAEALSATASELHAAALAAMAGIRHANTGYAYWLGSPQRMQAQLPRVVWIGRQESLAADFEQLKQLLGLPGQLQLPQGSSAHRAPAGSDTGLSSLAIDNLQRWYAEDRLLVAACDDWRSRNQPD